MPTLVPGLPSPYESVGGLVYFPRMIAKIRLHAEGKLPEDHIAMLGADNGYDGRCSRFIGVPYDEIKAQALAGRQTAEELLEWCFCRGRRPNEEEIQIWNSFLSKRGWRDPSRKALERRLREAGQPLECGIVTMFDFIDWDEGRPPYHSPDASGSK